MCCQRGKELEWSDIVDGNSSVDKEVSFQRRQWAHDDWTSTLVLLWYVRERVWPWVGGTVMKLATKLLFHNRDNANDGRFSLPYLVQI